VPTDGAIGQRLLDLMLGLCDQLVAQATVPVLGLGVATPGVVNSRGMVVEGIRFDWHQLDLSQILADRFNLPIYVINDSDAAALAEFTFGEADGGGLMAINIGIGLGAGLIIDGVLLKGRLNSAGEISHITVVPDGGQICDCGRRGCLETVFSAGALRQASSHASQQDVAIELASIERLIASALAPIVSALNLSEIVLCGAPELVDAKLADGLLAALRERLMPYIARELVVRLTSLGQDIVLAGAMAAVLSGELGVA